MALPAYQARPPLAGKPPFATDDPDDIFADPQPQRRYRQPPKEDSNARTSAYNHYDGYLDEKNPGMVLMNGDDDYETERNKHAALAAATSPNRMPVPQQTHNQMPVPLAAPRPGYAAPVAALMPQPSPSPDANSRMPRSPPGLDAYGAPRVPPAAALAMQPPKPSPIQVPSTPHPLPPTMTPIQPVFARPAKAAPPPSDIKWGPDSILRGNSEERLLPRRGEKGDDFWRRFSMIAKEENRKPSSQKQSMWLRKTQNGVNRLSRWVWIIGLILLACVGLGIGLGVYLSQKSPAHKPPTALGGSANESLTGESATLANGAKGTGAVSVTPHVSPTNTVARRDELPPIPTALFDYVLPPRSLEGVHDGAMRHRKRHLNRTSH